MYGYARKSPNSLSKRQMAWLWVIVGVCVCVCGACFIASYKICASIFFDSVAVMMVPKGACQWLIL